MSYKSRVSRERNPHKKDDAKEKPFFSKKKAGKDAPGNDHFFQAKPSIQRLSTPIDDEKLGTNDARMEKDKEIQEKPLPSIDPDKEKKGIQKKGDPIEETKKKNEAESDKMHQEISLGASDSPSLAGRCIPGRSTSECADGVGYYISKIDNQCCTRPCTVEHEKIHVNDLDECCRRYNKARKAEGADVTKVDKMWSDWLAVARLISECKAYSNDAPCAERLAKQIGCNDKKEEPQKSGELESDTIPESEFAETESNDDDSEEETAQETDAGTGSSGVTNDKSGCCLDIALYAQEFKKEANMWCGRAAGKTLPPCPFNATPKPAPIVIPK